MIRWTRATLLGFLSWLIPLIVSFAIFPVKQSNAPLFQNLMNVAGLLTGGVLFLRYFRERKVSTREAAAVGLYWLALNLALDYPIFSHGPMRMTAMAYLSEIGSAYLAIPIFTVCAARLARS